MSLYLAAILLLLIATRASTSSSKQCYGPDYTETFPFYGIASDICIHAYYNSSTTKSLKITLSYGDSIYGTESFSDKDPSFDEKTICDSDFPSPFKGFDACSICLGFDDIFLSDNWARICPKYIFKCLAIIGGSIKKESYSMDCFNVGDDDKDDIAEIVGGNTDFTFKLLSSNALTKDIVTDLFVAPFSISNALYPLMMAANGDTLKEIMAVFELKEDPYDIFDSYDTLIQSLQHKTNNLIDIIDNKIWINSVWYQLISPQFLHDFDRFGDIISCNFKNNSYIETMRIDTETEELTHNLIKHPLDNKNLSSSTVMLFTNTMYFKANWKYPFITNISETFTDSNQEKIKIEMMITDNIRFNKYNDSDVEVIELPFNDDFSDISFIMIRSTQQKYIRDGPISTIEFEKSLNRDLLQKWLNGLNEASYAEKICLPYLEMYNMEDITDSLKAIGLNDIFDPTKADLTNLTIPHYKVYETNLNRQDYMKVTPKGIEMASFVTDGNDGKDDTNQGAIKHADKPFLFLIIDRSVNLILYGGRITNPKGWIIYDPNNKNDDEKHSKIGIMILSLFVVFICSYCIIKYAYNRTVMQLTGIKAIPHIEQFKICKQFCNEKIQTIYQTDSVQISPPPTYAQLVPDENMTL